MNVLFKRYCLDTNVLMVAWNSYYAPDLCPSYWDILSDFGRKDIVFIPREVANEITKIDDDLSHWLLNSGIQIHEITGGVIEKLNEIYNKSPSHKFLVDNKKQRSLADPWVIAHAMHNGATVVTKEVFVISPDSNNIRIPNVCANMGVKCINDFEMLKELNVTFSCTS